jgi:transposase
MGCHQETKNCVARRTAEGKIKIEIVRWLKRYVAREVFPHLIRSVPAEPSRQPDLRQSAC